MWSLKKCPRCKGDIFIDEDIGRMYEKCLQCGYEREILNSIEKDKSEGLKKTAAV